MAGADGCEEALPVLTPRDENVLPGLCEVHVRHWASTAQTLWMAGTHYARESWFKHRGVHIVAAPVRERRGEVLAEAHDT